MALVNDLKKSCSDIKDREVLLCPPAVSIAPMAYLLKDHPIKLGAQNLHWEAQGAFTGELSGSMLKEAGCAYVIVGHSERRQFFGDTNDWVNKKMKAAFKAGVTPIVCIGETLQEREANQAFAVVEKQMKEGLSGLDQNQAQSLVLAYEPVWAIGTGKTATPQQAQEMHAFIRKLLSENHGKENANSIRILYGGSVKPENSQELLSQPDIDGALVGGACLKAESFLGIINSAAAAHA